jgi:hypothetical protein
VSQQPCDLREKRPLKRLKIPDLPQPQSPHDSQAACLQQGAGAGLQQGAGAGAQQGAGAGLHESQLSHFFERRKRSKKLGFTCQADAQPLPQPQPQSDAGAGATSAGGFAG